jgi:phytoene synthase
MMLPILGSRDPAAAREPARQLGLAFQLTNFIRDVAEDLDRGRVYLPEVHLAEFGVTRAHLERRVATPHVKSLIRYEVSVARDHYRRAAPGIPLLNRGSQACMRTAFRLYGGILEEVEAADYDVFAGRATVPNRRRAAVALRSLATRPGTPIAVPA